MTEMTVDQLRAAAKRAYNAGDIKSAQELIAAGQKLENTSVQNAPFRLGGFRENLIGSGEIDTPGEYLGDAIKAAGAGGARGIKSLLDLPEMGAGLIRQGYQKVTGQKVEPLEETYLGGGFDKGVRGITSLGGDANAIDYRSPNTLGKYAGTIGEFVGGAGAATQLTKPIPKLATIAGGGSEAAGQLTEGTSIEPFARITGALITPGITNQTFKALAQRSANRPTVEALKNEKNQAYKLVSQGGEGFDAGDIDDLISASTREASVAGYYPLTDDTTTKALEYLNSLKGRTVYMDDLDKVRRKLGKLYKRADDEVAILSIIKSVDDIVASKAETNSLVQAARAANAKYSKALLLEKAFTKADKQIASTGSGGNIVNKYRQTLTSISENPKKAQFFTKDELATMDRIIKGNVGANTLRLIGKLSPSGNGLMAALNLGAVAMNPAMLGVSVTAGASKALSERQIIKAVEKLKDLVAAGGVKQPKFAELRAVAVELLSPQFIAPRAGGLPTLIDQEERN